MTPDASYYQFSKEVWKAVNFQARHTLVRKEFCPEQSRVESVHCVHLDEETDYSYGKQVWFFEATGVDPVGRNQRVYGALEFAVQYGLLEPARAVLMEDPQHRQRFLQSIVRPTQADVWANPSTKLWVRLTLGSVIILSAIWLLYLAAVLVQ
jgi:hypothetical protein